jgi:formylglycine-generating enzyme required for sulfatase activity
MVSWRNTLMNASDVLSILPPPFEWCEMPGVRQFRLGTDEGNKGTYDIDPFYMAKYQTTFEQFQVFVDDPQGFTNSQWWRGLAADVDHRTAPGTQGFTRDRNLPRENVSWYDAVAFCRWISSKAGYEVRLPAEWEWQWAAQGPDGREYPWGEKYIQGYANVDEKASNIRGGVYLEETTPVGSYAQGASPFGVMDMAGNVWEWCLNEYENPKNIGLAGDGNRVARGGSWIDLDYEAQAVSRNYWGPNFRDDYVGFRVVVSSPIH